MTLFRLGLNVATTRLILLEGEAGHIIEAFGQFVVRGNYVVGAVIFLILIVINFVVITKGAGRIAEVAARFTLDAMPGKQMAIDAELNAGLIDEDTARKRRRKVQKEADFYGAMDGSSKFVRGDAVAAIMITMINVFGGLAIGILQKGLPIVEALKKYTLLSIGDGLVSQIPALVISVAAGLLVTRASDDENLSRQIGGQLTSYPKALGVASAALGFLCHHARDADDPVPRAGRAGRVGGARQVTARRASGGRCGRMAGSGNARSDPRQSGGAGGGANPAREVRAGNGPGDAATPGEFQQTHRTRRARHRTRRRARSPSPTPNRAVTCSTASPACAKVSRATWASSCRPLPCATACTSNPANTVSFCAASPLRPAASCPAAGWR